MLIDYLLLFSIFFELNITLTQSTRWSARRFISLLLQQSLLKYIFQFLKIKQGQHTRFLITYFLSEHILPGKTYRCLWRCSNAAFLNDEELSISAVHLKWISTSSVCTCREEKILLHFLKCLFMVFWRAKHRVYLVYNTSRTF